MDILELQRRLSNVGAYAGELDGKVGPQTRAGVLKFLSIGPDTEADGRDFEVVAHQLGVPTAYIRGFYDVESSGDPFIDGRPTILFEPHRFARATGQRFNASHPHISYPKWDRTKYPRTQKARYEQLVEAVCLDPLAGFASASYGGFQILGENYARCGCRDAMEFAWQESQSVGAQLRHLALFIKSDVALLRALQRGDWVQVAKRYNGSAYHLNRYDVRLAQATRRYAA